MSKKSLRESLVNAGCQLVWDLGYGAATVRDICSRADAPQGSFTNHFRSKEHFVTVVSDKYFNYLSDLVLNGLRDQSVPPRQRLRNYFEVITEKLANADFSRGCLIGNLAAEASPQSEVIRTRLSTIFAEWTAAFTDCIRDAQHHGEISTGIEAEQLAEFLLDSWHGAMLRMKVDRSRRPLDTFQHVVFSSLLLNEQI